jgi:hypothetical protein
MRSGSILVGTDAATEAPGQPDAAGNFPRQARAVGTARPRGNPIILECGRPVRPDYAASEGIRLGLRNFHVAQLFRRNLG